ncbi:MAG: molecular chaperone DnaJ [Oscillospiraceae bacterium]|jgi:molecular chaperone DnaJ|nr:molecular chaperone DnaJ [Oscillospiraceae bacterium]
MADKRDYYESLGISKGASDDEIKRAYRQMAKKYHPDVNPGNAEAEARFKEVGEAYEVLSDPDKKARYDQYGHAGVDPNFGAGGGGYGGGFDVDLGDIFGSIFGGGSSSRSRNGPRRGGDVQAEVDLTFAEAAFGVDKEIEVSRIEHCPTCSGSGAKAGTSAERCGNCNGSGTVTSQQRTVFGTMQTSSDCPKCGGTGKIIKQPCEKCRGQGRVRKSKKFTVSIPAGIDEGQAVTMRGQGSVGTNGGGAGDLYVVVSIKPHERFTRRGTSVLLDMPVSITQAALGDELEVPTLDGKVRYKMPEGTQPDTTFRLRGSGIPNLRGGGRGDQYVTVKVAVPTGLSNEQKELLRQFAAASGESAPPDKGRKKKRK